MAPTAIGQGHLKNHHGSSIHIFFSLVTEHVLIPLLLFLKKIVELTHALKIRLLLSADK